jgi:hypothetical protein
MTLMPRHIWLLPVLAAIGLGAALLLMPARTIRPDRHLASPEHIPEAVRAILHKRMERHGNDMVDLSWSVVLLKYDLVARLARHIAEEAPVSRPLNDVDTPINAALPARFFDLQDQLVMETKQLALAATGGNPDRLAETYSAVARTCVACHALYLTAAAPSVPR